MVGGYTSAFNFPVQDFGAKGRLKIKLQKVPILPSVILRPLHHDAKLTCSGIHSVQTLGSDSFIIFQRVGSSKWTCFTRNSFFLAYHPIYAAPIFGCQSKAIITRGLCLSPNTFHAGLLMQKTGQLLYCRGKQFSTNCRMAKKSEYGQRYSFGVCAYD